MSKDIIETSDKCDDCALLKDNEYFYKRAISKKDEEIKTLKACVNHLEKDIHALKKSATTIQKIICFFINNKFEIIKDASIIIITALIVSVIYSFTI